MLIPSLLLEHFIVFACPPVFCHFFYCVLVTVRLPSVPCRTALFTTLLVPSLLLGYHPTIGLVEVLWKTVPGVINCNIGLVFQFHDVLHGLWAVRCTRTAFLEAKMLQQLMEIREEVTYVVLLYLQKLYNVLYHE